MPDPRTDPDPPDLPPSQSPQALAVGFAIAKAAPRGFVVREPDGGLRFDAELLTAALIDAGLLLPAGAKVSEEWTVRDPAGRDDPGGEFRCGGRALVDGLVAQWPGSRTIRREVRTWPDGSRWTGPWVPVDPEEAPDGD